MSVLKTNMNNLKTISRYTALSDYEREKILLIINYFQECVQDTSRSGSVKEPSDLLDRSSISDKGAASCKSAAEEHVAEEMELHFIQVCPERWKVSFLTKTYFQALLWHLSSPVEPGDLQGSRQGEQRRSQRSLPDSCRAEAVQEGGHQDGLRRHHPCGRPGTCSWTAGCHYRAGGTTLLAMVFMIALWRREISKQFYWTCLVL